MTSNRQWLLKERPTGMVGPEHFELQQTECPEPKLDAGDDMVVLDRLSAAIGRVDDLHAAADPLRFAVQGGHVVDRLELRGGTVANVFRGDVEVRHLWHQQWLRSV